MVWHGLHARAWHTCICMRMHSTTAASAPLIVHHADNYTYHIQVCLTGIEVMLRVIITLPPSSNVRRRLAFSCRCSLPLIVPPGTQWKMHSPQAAR